jgi:hypothetical protein
VSVYTRVTPGDLMQILAHVPNALRRRLEASVPRGARVRFVSPPDLLDALRTEAGCTVILDPSGLSDDFLALVAVGTTRAGGRLIAYAKLERSTCRQLATMVDAVLPILVLAETDDDIPRLRAHLIAEFESVPALVLRGLAKRLARLRPELGERTAGLFAGAPIPATTAEFATSLGATEKQVWSWYRGQRMSSTNDFLHGAKVARAYDLARSGQPVASAWERADFGSERAMRDQFHRFVDSPPTHACRSLLPQEMARALVVALRGTTPREKKPADLIG